MLNAVRHYVDCGIVVSHESGAGEGLDDTATGSVSSARAGIEACRVCLLGQRRFGNSTISLGETGLGKPGSDDMNLTGLARSGTRKVDL